MALNIYRFFIIIFTHNNLHSNNIHFHKNILVVFIKEKNNIPKIKAVAAGTP